VFLEISIGKNPEDSNLAWKVKAMQWTLFYLSIGHDRCVGATNIEPSTALRGKKWRYALRREQCDAYVHYQATAR
jgi:hypothetical protein